MIACESLAETLSICMWKRKKSLTNRKRPSKPLSLTDTITTSSQAFMRSHNIVCLTLLTPICEVRIPSDSSASFMRTFLRFVIHIWIRLRSFLTKVRAIRFGQEQLQPRHYEEVNLRLFETDYKEIYDVNDARVVYLIYLLLEHRACWERSRWYLQLPQGCVSN